MYELKYIGLPGVILQNAPTYTIHPPITKTSENFLFLKV